jgi:Flp pilus assembly pilin Flp
MLKLALRFVNGASCARAIEYGVIAAGISVAIIVTLPLWRL